MYVRGYAEEWKDRESRRNDNYSLLYIRATRADAILREIIRHPELLRNFTARLKYLTPSLSRDRVSDRS